MWRRRVTQAELSSEQWINLVKNLDGLPLRHIEPFGGDVLLRPEVLFPLIEASAERGLAVDIPLNGVLLGAEKAARMIAMPINTIYVSVDGVSEDHDRVRGVKNNFDAIASGIGVMRQVRGDRSRPALICNTTVSRLNYDQCLPIAQAAVDVGFDCISFEYCGEFPPEAVTASAIDGIPSEPYYERRGESLLLTADQAVRLKRDLQTLKALKLKEKIAIVTRNIDFLSTAEMASGKPRINRCYVCRTLVTIDPFGNVLACPFFDKYHLGNLTEKSLNAIWNNERHQRFMKLQGEGALPMCRYCILSVERNVSLWQALSKWYLTHTGRSRW